MTREYSTEEIVLTMDILTYMSENEVSLEEAYEEKGVSEEMQLLEVDIEEIKKRYLV